MTNWSEALPVRVVMLSLLLAGAYLIWQRVPTLIEPTLLGEFPVVATVITLFAYLTAVHTILSAATALMKRAAGNRHG